ncbi:MAG: radical SAM protein, partial [Rubrivivax sp.]
MNFTTPPRVLSIIPPMTQLNTPYPSTAYLTGFLRSRGVQAAQVDLALGLVLELLSAQGLQQIREVVQSLPPDQRSHRVQAFEAQFERYAATITPTIAFLQGRDATLAHRIAGRQFLPEGERFASLDAYVDPDDPEGEHGGDPLAWAFGALGQQDRARHLATLYLNDIADVLRDAVDPRFEFVRYAESLAMSQPSFDPLAQALAAPLNLVDRTLARLTREALTQHQPTVVLLSVPFPGAVYGALRIAQAVKTERPEVRIALGGGYVNTELRELAEPRLFDFVDAVTLDAGERPLLALLEHWHGTRSRSRLVRTFMREEASGEANNGVRNEIPHEGAGEGVGAG